MPDDYFVEKLRQSHNLPQNEYWIFCHFPEDPSYDKAFLFFMSVSKLHLLKSFSNF